jgi:hypothetical protein
VTVTFCWRICVVVRVLPQLLLWGEMKQLTREPIQSRKAEAVWVLRNVLDNPKRAEEIAEESLEDYAARRKIQNLNLKRRATCPGRALRTIVLRSQN